jgi:glycosyltransferase involved in cell wall biosynthesis
MARSPTSIVLPVHNQDQHIGQIVEGYRAALELLPGTFEILLVTNACTDRSIEVCADLAERHEMFRHIDLAEGGWGRAVKAGIGAASGDVLCYTNSARTTPEILTLMLAYGVAYPNVVLKANRRIRAGRIRRLGSLLYNLECRMLFDLAVWDINGTPKVFPRGFERLLELRSDGDLIDAEFALTCKREDYPVVEVPILATVRHGGVSTTNYRSALRMYLGAYRMYRHQP